jgi:hypothetical protein
MGDLVGYDDPPVFPTWTVTNEAPPRWIKILGTSAIDPDVWVAELSGHEEKAWVVKGSGTLLHKSVNRKPDELLARVRILPWPQETR